MYKPTETHTMSASASVVAYPPLLSFSNTLPKINIKCAGLLSTLMTMTGDNTNWEQNWNSFENEICTADKLVNTRFYSGNQLNSFETVHIAYVWFFKAMKCDIESDSNNAKICLKWALTEFLRLNGPIFDKTQSRQPSISHATELNNETLVNDKCSLIPTIIDCKDWIDDGKGLLTCVIIQCYSFYGFIEQNNENYCEAKNWFEKANIVAQNSNAPNTLVTVPPISHTPLESSDFSIDFMTGNVPIIEPMNILQTAEKSADDVESKEEKSPVAEESNETSRSLSQRIDRESKPYICDVCGRGYNYLHSLKDHVKLHTGEAMACHVCSKQFTTTARLQTHINRHLGIKAFECDTCHRRFTDKCSLTRHYRKHTNEKPYHCSHCNQRFRDYDAVTIHIRRRHTHERPYQCQLCERRFITNSDLKNHAMVHSTVRAFKCEICQSAFKRKGDLTKHNNRKHS